MRVERITVTETCNQSCGFCHAHRATDRPELVSWQAVRTRIQAAQASGAQEIVITGGEPTLRRDLIEIVREAATGGTRVVLETNARLLDSDSARALAAAGLAGARVPLVGWGAPECDAITGDNGGFDAALAGIRNLAAAAIVVEISVPVVRQNVERVARLTREIATNDLPVVGIVAVVPLDGPRRDELASLTQIADALTSMADTARRYGIPFRLDGATYLPPCLFPSPERVAHLYALNRGNAERSGFRRIAACPECLVQDRCPGVPGGAEPRHVEPIRDDRLRRRLTITSTIEDQIRRELLSSDVQYGGSDGPTVEHTVRINFHCNQACEFCFVSTHLPAAEESVVRTAIENAARAGDVIVLSGGEPTLNPRLAEYIALAKSAGAHEVEIQTNAIRLADRQLTRSIIDAGLDRVMVSLHGASAEVSDAVTRAPGTFEQTLRGLDALADISVRLRLNFVVCRKNFAEFPDFIDLVAKRWPSAAVVVSFVGSHTDVVPRTSDLIPKFSEVLPALSEGLARAVTRGVVVFGFDSMCGLPLCLVPESHRSAVFRTATEDSAGEFLKGAVCDSCAEGDRCYGVRRGYAELYGTGELQPFAKV